LNDSEKFVICNTIDIATNCNGLAYNNGVTVVADKYVD